MADKVLSLLGMAMRAGKVASGEFSVEKSVKTGKSRLVIVSEEASDNTKKMFTNMCTYYNVPIYFYSSKEVLGHAIGKNGRASVSVQDKGFADTIINLMKS